MKKLQSILRSLFPSRRIPALIPIRIRFNPRYILLFVFLTSLTSCFQKFYGTNTVSKTDTSAIQQLIVQKKYFIIHSPDGIFMAKHPVIVNNNFVADLDSLKEPFEKYLNPKVAKPNHFGRKDNLIVLNQVHLFGDSSTITTNGKLNLSMNQIYRMDVYQIDKGAGRQSTVLGILGIGLGVTLFTIVTVDAVNNFHFSYNVSM
jgi:hypothetical protein